jgi:hypothetical protein
MYVNIHFIYVHMHFYTVMESKAIVFYTFLYSPILCAYIFIGTYRFEMFYYFILCIYLAIHQLKGIFESVLSVDTSVLPIVCFVHYSTNFFIPKTKIIVSCRHKYTISVILNFEDFPLLPLEITKWYVKW